MDELHIETDVSFYVEEIIQKPSQIEEIVKPKIRWQTYKFEVLCHKAEQLAVHVDYIDKLFVSRILSMIDWLIEVKD